MNESAALAAAGRAPAFPSPVQALVDAFYSEEPPRVWSLIVTAFGDMAGDTTEPLPLTALTPLMALARIDSGALRTALSRLVASGILTREKRGRASFFTAAPGQNVAFRQAAKLIYGEAMPRPTGMLHLVAIDASATGAAAKAALEQLGYRSLQPRLMVRPQHAGLVPGSIAGAVPFLASAGPEHASLMQEAYGIDRLASGYRSLLALYRPLATSISQESGPQLAPETAALARLMLVHAFRRLVLRDPFLPAALLPDDWPGLEARVLFDALHPRLVDLSAPWLRAQGFPACSKR